MCTKVCTCAVSCMCNCITLVQSFCVCVGGRRYMRQTYVTQDLTLQDTIEDDYSNKNSKPSQLTAIIIVFKSKSHLNSD